MFYFILYYIILYFIILHFLLYCIILHFIYYYIIFYYIILYYIILCFFLQLYFTILIDFIFIQYIFPCCILVGWRVTSPSALAEVVIVNWTNGIGQRPYQLYLHSQGAKRCLGLARSRSIGFLAGEPGRLTVPELQGFGQMFLRGANSNSTTHWDSHRLVPEGFQWLRRCLVDTIWTECAGSLKG